VKCFYHIDKDAVGIGKACHKGICTDCAEDLGHSLACKNTCIEKAEIVEQIIVNNSMTYKTNRTSIYFMPAFLGFIVVLMLVVGLQERNLMNISVAMGSGFLFFGILMLVINKKWVSKLKA